MAVQLNYIKACSKCNKEIPRYNLRKFVCASCKDTSTSWDRTRKAILNKYNYACYKCKLSEIDCKKIYEKGLIIERVKNNNMYKNLRAVCVGCVKAKSNFRERKRNIFKNV